MRQSKSKSKECFDIHKINKRFAYPRCVFIFVQDDLCSFYEDDNYRDGAELATSALAWDRDSNVGEYICTVKSIEELQQLHPELFI